MKKNYVRPNTTNINIRPTKLMAGSANGTSIYGDANKNYETLSRSGNFWTGDDDE